MTRHAVHYSSKSTEWATPQATFDELNAEFGFTLDVCATHANAKCPRHYTKKENGLTSPWPGVCWMNPPYGREIGHWIRKAYEESQRGALVVGLLPARTDTRWFHEWILGKAEIRFLRGRLHFGESRYGAPFPSMIVIWGESRRQTQKSLTPVERTDRVRAEADRKGRR